MFGIPVHIFASVIRVVKLANECMNSLCDEIEDTPESAAINPSNGINYFCTAVVLLPIACLLLLLSMT